jgi:hypothetical protein
MKTETNRQPKKGYYSLIQYCPDLGRHESANVGVLVFCPDLGFLDAIVTRNNARIIEFFGNHGHNWRQINSYKKGIVNRLKAESSEIKDFEGLKRFIDSRANLIQITDPRSMTIVEPEKDLHSLFEEFFGADEKREKRENLRNRFMDGVNSAGIQKKIKRDLRVHVPVMNREIEVPFGYQNGRFNLITPVRFESKDADQSFRTACKYAVEGRSLFNHEDDELGPLQLLLIGKFRSQDEDTYNVVKRTCDEGNVRLFRSTDMFRLMDEIQREGKDIAEET